MYSDLLDDRTCAATSDATRRRRGVVKGGPSHFPVPQFLDGTLIVEPDGSISVGLEVIEVVYYYD